MAPIYYSECSIHYTDNIILIEQVTQAVARTLEVLCQRVRDNPNKIKELDPFCKFSQVL